MRRIDKLAQDLKMKQDELELLRNNGSVCESDEIEKEIDALQKAFDNMKGTAAAEEEVNTFEELKTTTPDPDIDDQITFMYDRIRGHELPHAEKFDHAIYKSLIAIKNMREAGTQILGELKEALSLPEDVMRRIPRPLDLEAQSQFVAGLAIALGSPKTELQRELFLMYQALEASIEQCKWVAQATAEWLQRENGSVPIQEPSMRASRDSDLEILVRYDDVASGYSASFTEGGDDLISGTGKTPQEAVDSLFEAKEKKRQGILFPEGGAHV